MLGKDHSCDKSGERDDGQRADAYLEELVDDLFIFIGRKKNFFEEAYDESPDLVYAKEEPGNIHDRGLVTSIQVKFHATLFKDVVTSWDVCVAAIKEMSG